MKYVLNFTFVSSLPLTQQTPPTLPLSAYHLLLAIPRSQLLLNLLLLPWTPYRAQGQ